MRLSARESCPVCFHAIVVSFAMWLIIKHYIILTNFCVSVRAKVSIINYPPPDVHITLQTDASEVSNFEWASSISVSY